MPLAELRSRLKRTWAAIDKAHTEADRRLEDIRALVKAAEAEGRIDSEDISVVVFGSLARREWTVGSDLDWTLLIDGQADHRQLKQLTVWPPCWKKPGTRHQDAQALLATWPSAMI